jgi:ketosteroid isomerase-like protein
MKMAKVEEAMRVALAFHKALNAHDIDGMMAFMSDDCVFENTAPAPGGTRYEGKEAVTQFWKEFFRQSPQAHFKLEGAFGLGRRCVVYWRYEWVDLDGKAGHVRGVDIIAVRNGRITEKLSYVKG